MQGFEIRVPASSANLGPGFDCMAMALNLHTTLRLKPSAFLDISPRGKHLASLPRDETNLVYRIMAEVFAHFGKSMPHLSIEIESEIPLARGLGSSSAATVAALLGANALLGSPLSTQDILHWAVKIEGHPDNAAAALLGGIVVTAQDNAECHALGFSPPKHLGVLLVIPEHTLETNLSRTVLPATLTRQDAVFNLSHATLLAVALLQGRLDLVGKAMKDRLHQPQRAQLVPGLSEILAGAVEYGALGAALSGAGPSMLCLYDKQTDALQNLEIGLRNILDDCHLQATTVSCEIESQGAQVQDVHCN